MKEFSNREILSSVLVKWLEPLTSSLINENIHKVPFLDNLQSKILSTGWVSASWRISNDMAPYATTIADAFMRPILSKAMSGIDDASVPEFAHRFVDSAIERGELIIMDGNIKFNREDLGKLKRMLNLNLPATELETYQVKENG